MPDRGNDVAAGLVTIAAAAVAVAVGATPLGVIAAAAVVVSTIVERRSTVFALLAGALLVAGAELGALAAVFGPATYYRRDLRTQGLAALRRSIAATLSPLVMLGGAVAGFQGRGRTNGLWWLISWGPASIVAVLVMAVRQMPSAPTIVAIGLVGLLLGLEPAREAPSVKPRSDEEPPSDTVVAEGGGTTDWSEVNPAGVEIQQSEDRSERELDGAVVRAKALDAALINAASTVALRQRSHAATEGR